ncbi:class I SAM-dependent DNA methyltransferase [Jiella mangrovi]|uniref:site-specific DNA-methyltransferase (adenine-specific) n=1 Tax=Jiella mangrovi TaxID=2821407 RepID=A0ABS4BNG5_9HYPH|nr:class I SAM-dependent DNA methyltransferase [Jiella mangrovi]MBP0618268.1 class I SAM-dependent DNA methyltransferase [Jiella mangrovi]
MRLSWNEIRARAATFAREWKDAHYERGDTQTFYNEFFDIFDIKRRKVASFEEPVKKLGNKQGFVDLFWKGVLLVEQKSAGRKLAPAKQQALDYFPGIKDVELPRYILLSDFQTFELYDLDEGGEPVAFALADLPKHVEHFAFILGVQKRTFRDQDPVNIKAAEIMGRLHDALEESGYGGHDLERFLVRLLFCLFADDTGIFEPRDIFLDLIEQRTSEDGSSVGMWLAQLFDVLDTEEDKRQRSLDEDLARFPYVNGSLFEERLRIPSFDAATRNALLEACRFNWSTVSPAIFGALFQSVMDRAERRKTGGHYTTEKNILKLIGPLFLDELREEFEKIKRMRRGRPKALQDFQTKLGTLRFFDPACGCGNFLIITYRELRILEMEVLQLIYSTGQQELDVSALSKVDVDQFYGIELGEFAARIAEVALWMMDHIMNNRLSLEFGQAFARIPLKTAPNIRHGDALETDWQDVLPAANCTAILGNPPFIGSKYQSDEQRAQVRRIANLGGSGGTLDYVAAWFLRAGEYIQQNTACRIAFVSTNSITQGEQVAQLWPILFDRYGLEIDYGHRTFEWGSDARGKAHVHVVIVGLSHRDHERNPKRLFSYDDIKGDPVESTHGALTAYLFDAGTVHNRHLVVYEVGRPINGAPRLLSGSQPIDGGHYIFDREEREAFLAVEPAAERFMRPYVGAREYINGADRWILALQDAQPHELRAMPEVQKRMALVRTERAKSPRKSTLKIADQPARYNVEVLPTAPFLALPESSSERREYAPIGWLKPPTIPSNLLKALPSDDSWFFGVLTSRMHMSWLRHIGGRIKSDYRYTIGIVYNTFPLPNASPAQMNRVRDLANKVIAAREEYPNSSLADLYDPDVMPAPLRKAHKNLDRAVDGLYRRAAFASDRDRVEHMFGLYEEMIRTSKV